MREESERERERERQRDTQRKREVIDNNWVIYGMCM